MTLGQIAAAGCAESHIYRINVSIRSSSISGTNFYVGGAIANFNCSHRGRRLHLVISARFVHIDGQCTHAHSPIDGLNSIFILGAAG